MDNTDDMLTAWRKAEEDLKIKIQAPYILRVDNREIPCYLLVENFGSRKGTIILSMDNMDDFNISEGLGYYCSALNPVNYSTYNRNQFIDTLNDWGFFGEKNGIPDWYTGQAWS